MDTPITVAIHPEKVHNPVLTPEYLELITLIAKGFSVKETTELMLMSDSKIRMMRGRLHDTFNTKNDVGIVMAAIKNNIIKIDVQ